MADDLAATFSTRPRLTKRYTLLALVLSLFSMGLGHIYVGRTKRGLWFALAGAICSFALIAVACLPPTPLIACALFLLIVATLGVYLYVAVDAARTARRLRTIGRTRRWPLYLALVIFNFTVGTIVDRAKTRIDWRDFNVASASMLPTLRLREIFVASRDYFGTHDPSRGDLATLVPPASPHSIWVKRIVGLPGDKVQMRGGHLYLNGTEIAREPGPEADQLVEYGKSGLPFFEIMPDGRHFEIIRFGESQFDDTHEVTVPPDTYFVLGDNRNDSLDSRMPSLGLVPRANLRDKPVFLLWSSDWHRIGRKLD